MVDGTVRPMIPRGWPPLIRLMIVHGLIGFVVAGLFVTALVLVDPGGVGRLILYVGGWPVLLLLWYFTGLTFGGVQIATAIMSQGGDAPPPASGARYGTHPAKGWKGTAILALATPLRPKRRKGIS